MERPQINSGVYISIFYVVSGIVSFPLAKQAQLPPDSAFSSEESQTRQQVPATCLHTQCRTRIALLIATAQLENKAQKTFIDPSVLSALIPRFPINVLTFPKGTHQDLGCCH